MAYTTAQKVRNLLVGVGTEIMSDEQINEFIKDAESIVNSFLSSKYSVPFIEVPDIIETITKNYAAYFVMRTLYSQEGKNENEWVESFKSLADELLNKIINDEISLRVNKDTIMSNTSNYSPIFDLDEETNWEVDSKRYNEILNKRKRTWLK